MDYEYVRLRKHFGQHQNFSDSPVQLLNRIAPEEKVASEWVKRVATTTDFDCIPEVSESSVNTSRNPQSSSGMMHLEGGWPKDVNTNDFQDKNRHIMRIENMDVKYKQAVRYLVDVSSRVVEQNNSVDMYEIYFEDDTTDLSSEPPSAKTLTVLRDPHDIKRHATSICWHPDGAARLAVSYSILQFQKMPENMPVASYIWDVNNPNQPESEILPSSPLCSLVFNPKSPDTLVGGSYNGLLGHWDLRKGSTAIETSLIEKSHHDPVYEVAWIQSRTNTEFCSVSTDGYILWWDTRKLASGPMDSMELKDENGLSFGATSLEYRADAGATRFLVGTESGNVLSVERRAKKDLESQKQLKTIYGSEGGAHHGPVYSVKRNPYNLKFFLTLGDWSSKVWCEDAKTPVFLSRYEASYMTAGCWSPTRPGVFFTARMDGTLDVWDLFYKHNEPVYPTKIGEVGLSSVCVHGKGKLVGVGAVDGSVTLLQLGDALAVPQPNEKNGIAAMFERELKREKHLEMRSIQLKREKKEQAAKKQQVRPEVKSYAEDDEMTKKIDEDFFAAINRFQNEDIVVAAAASIPAEEVIEADSLPES
eukprot:TRINITY_DN7502_c0_g1_i3.p1 TRINITY_DN7502_c0_g1~~TRINITY_DN7502_c0_g1_i3.p1  ORF type:complete len:605 (-),score=131.23 TRINITY_DN7502_c0_g1_i3:30-1796(-)